ncbi:MAG: Uma2 family endonuclease [Chloroflexota bacterium]
MQSTKTIYRETEEKNIENESPINDSYSTNGFFHVSSTNGVSPKSNNGTDVATLVQRADLGGFSLDGYRVSLEDYWTHVYDQTERFYEWNNGILEEKPPMTDFVKYLMYLWFLDILRDFLYAHPMARFIGPDMNFGFQTPNRYLLRAPDIGVVLNTNPVPLGDRDKSYQGIFDMCIESVSDSNRNQVLRDTVHKRREYAQAGVHEYFVLDENPRSRSNETAFYRLNANGIYVPIQPVNGAIYSSVLTGFGLRPEHLYERPEPVELIDDPVYQGFISPHVRAERLRTQWERQRADSEQQRADSEQQRAQQAERRVAELEQAGRRVVELEQALAEERASRTEAQALISRLRSYLSSLGLNLPRSLR